MVAGPGRKSDRITSRRRSSDLDDKDLTEMILTCELNEEEMAEVFDEPGKVLLKESDQEIGKPE